MALSAIGSNMVIFTIFAWLMGIFARGIQTETKRHLWHFLNAVFRIVM